MIATQPTTNGHAPPRSRVNLRRKTSLAAGVLYVLTFVSMPTLVLYGPVKTANYILGAGPDTGAIFGVILEIIVALAGIGTAVALFPVLKRQNEGMAMALVGNRVLEAATIFIGVLCLLTVVSLRQAGAGADALVTSHTLVDMYNRIFLIGQSFLPAVDDLLLGILLYQSRLVPRVLPLLGLIGVPLLVAGDVAVLFGFVTTSQAAVTALPIALFEFSLGVWLIVKGFQAAPTLSGELRISELSPSLTPVAVTR
jgi:uncharacterized protein DUF4386